MTRSRGNSTALFSARNVARVVVAGAVVAGTPLALSGTANAATDDVWDRLAQCESGGRWNINTGNGYQGGLQFSPSTWRAHGGTGSAANASRAQQIAVAERVLASQGWGAWPSCSRKIGAKGKATPRTVPVEQPVQPQLPAPRPSSEQSGRIEFKPPVAPVVAPVAPAVPPVAALAAAPAVAPVAPVVPPVAALAAAPAAPAAAVAPAAPAAPLVSAPRTPLVPADKAPLTPMAAAGKAPVALPATPPAPVVPAARPSMKYVVAPGDSLSKIAKMKNVSGGWKGLHERNKDKVANPSALKVGQEISVD